MKYQSSTNIMSSFKVVLLSTSVLSAAIMLKFSVPAITDFAAYIPSIYDGVVSWMRPPYLYLVINCIIITIVASSKLQSSKDDDASLPPATTQPLVAMGIVEPQSTAAPIAGTSTQSDYPTAEYNYEDVVLSDSSGHEVKLEKGFVFESYEHGDVKNEEPEVIGGGGDGGVAFARDATSNKENEFVISKSTWTAVPESKVLTENSPANVKPPVSARFGHRRNLKSTPEGAKTVLGVSKPKKLDTLESTWRTITDGRPMPITRHLKKSDTWERDNRPQLEKTPQKAMTKAETFNDRTNTGTPSPGSSGGGSGKLRREASPSQDELNRRVEAFIKKFNEEMRLQRQESLNQYREMVSRGSH